MVSPIANTEPLGGVKVGTKVVWSASFAVALNATAAPEGPDASARTGLEGSVSTGNARPLPDRLRVNVLTSGSLLGMVRTADLLPVVDGLNLTVKFVTPTVGASGDEGRTTTLNELASAPLS
jgi:hypothetical protein